MNSEFAFNIILTAALSAGIVNSEAVIKKPEKQTLLLPKPRVEVEFLTEDYTKRTGKIAKFKTPGKQDEMTIRRKLYQTQLTVRAVIRAEEEAWVESFIREFLVSLPVKTADSFGNLVKIRAQKADRGGYESKMVEPFKKRSNALHILFTGMLTKDSSLPLIKEIDLSGMTIA